MAPIGAIVSIGLLVILKCIPFPKYIIPLFPPTHSSLINPLTKGILYDTVTVKDDCVFKFITSYSTNRAFHDAVTVGSRNCRLGRLCL